MKKNLVKLFKRKTKKPSPGDAVPDFEHLIADAPQGILIHKNFKALYANKSFATLLGYKSPKDILALPILRPLFSHDLWGQAEHEYDELTNGRKISATIRMPMIRKNGQEIWIAGTLSCVDMANAKAVQMNVFDITPQVEVEKTLLRAEQHLRSVLEILPYPIYIARQKDGRLLFVNRKTCLMFQRSAASMLRGTSVDFYVDPKEREDLRKLLETVNDVRDTEIKMRTTAGREFIAEFSAIRMEYNGESAILVALNDISERKALETKLQHQASTDSLTQIGNRRYFMNEAEQEISRSRRFNRPLTVMMIDVDHFKAINDKYGHAVGDAVLLGVVKRSNESLRQSDQMARLGGEEFAVLLPETNLIAAVRGAERLRQHMHERPIMAGSIAVPCTVSIGVAELRNEDNTIDDLLRRADEALYRAKKTGRNRVEQAT